VRISTASTVLRGLARTLVRYAAKGLAHTHPSWRRLMETEVQRIANGVEALIWAIGCVWAIRVERSINESRPELNCVLLFVGLYLTVHYFLTHLTWYGLAPDRLEFFSAPRGFLKLAIFFCMTGVVAFATPGGRSRRLFAALAFPFLAMLGLLSVAAGFQVINVIMPPQGNTGAEVILRGLCGPLFGVIVAALLSLPCVLLYRATAMPSAALALVPAIAKETGTAAPSHLSPHPYASLFEHLWPFICSLIIIAIFSRICHRWVSRAPGERGRPKGV
jgi:hypothetical protein